MKLSPTHLVFAIAVGVAPAVMAGQQDLAMERVAQKARPDPVAVVIARASQVPETVKTDRTIGECHLVNSLGVTGRDDPLSPVYVISPAGSVNAYFKMFEKRDIGLEGKIIMLQGPGHGELKEDGGQDYRYTPIADYIGADHATFLIEIGGLKVKAVYLFKVIDGGAIGGTEIEDKKNCPKGWIWKISTTSDANETRGQVSSLALISASRLLR